MTSFVKGKIDKDTNQKKSAYLYISTKHNKDTIKKLL